MGFTECRDVVSLLEAGGETQRTEPNCGLNAQAETQGRMREAEEASKSDLCLTPFCFNYKWMLLETHFCCCKQEPAVFLKNVNICNDA